MENSVLIPNPKQESEQARSSQERSHEAGTAHSTASHHDSRTIPGVLGNLSAQRVLAPVVIQPKLTIGAPDDPYEKEADDVAEQVMSFREPQAAGTSDADDDPSSHSQVRRKQATTRLSRQAMLGRIPIRTLQKTLGNRELARLFAGKSPSCMLPEVRRKCACGGDTEGECDECRMNRMAVQRSSTDADSDLEAPSIVESVLSTPGKPLAESARNALEPGFGHDFSGVRVHDDSQAAESASAVSALAYTAGNHIVFGSGQYAPGTDNGNRLLAHELTHTIQQTGGKPKAVSGSNSEGSTVDASATDLDESAEEGAEPAPSPEERELETSGESKELTEAGTPERSSSDGKGEKLAGVAEPAGARKNGNGHGVLEEPTLAPQGGAAKLRTGEPGQSGVQAAGGTRAEARGQVAPAAAVSGASPAPRSGTGPVAGGPSQSHSGEHAPGGGAAPVPPAHVDTSSPEALLQSVAAAPASSFSETLQSAQGAVPALQGKEKAALAASLPEVERPTGLPRRGEPPKGAPTRLPPGSAPSAKSGGGRPNAPPDTKLEVAAGPLPAARVSTAVGAPPPKEEEGGSWWSWLVNKVSGFVGSLPTDDPGLSTSAGPKPNVDLTGDADPNRNQEQEQLSAQSITDTHGHADAATTATFGENEIYPTVPSEKLRSKYKPGPPPNSRHTPHKPSPALSPDLRSQFDQSQTPAINAKANEQLAKYREEQIEHQKSSDQAREDGQKRIAEESEKSTIKQKGLQQQAKAEVDGERSRWREENRKVTQDYSTKAGQKRSEIDKQINDKVQTTDQTVSKTLTDAEAKADAERTRTEQEAEAKKREADARPKSFWESVGDAISSVFDEIKAAVNGLFDALRSFVKKVIDEAKAVVRGLIDLARSAIVGLIEAFGEALKALVTVALAAFPEIAEKARQWIDKKVASAVDTVNRVADELKTITDAILDTIGAALDTALAILQKAYIATLDVLEFVAKAPYELMELLEKVMAFIDEYNPFFGGLDKLSHAAKEIEEGARTTLQGMIDKIPGEVESVITKAAKSFGQAAEKHITGIWRHLKPALAHLAANWWGEIKQMVWNLVWPFNDKSPLWKDVPELIHLPGKILSSIWDGEFSKATDQFLLAMQKVNSILGIFYGWFFIASVLVGTIIGAFFGGAGAIPGAIAGATFAGEVGEGLLAAMVATETGVIAKAAYDLAFGPGTTEVNESAYDRIANSSLTLAITGVMMILGELAADLAKAIIDGVKGLFEVAEAPKVEVEVPKGETPQGDEGIVKDPAPGDIAIKEPIEGGGEVEVTKDGECLVCTSPCEVLEQLKKDFADVLADPDKAYDAARAKLEDAIQETDPSLKAKKAADAVEELKRAQKEKAPSAAAPSSEIRMEAMSKAANDAAGAIKDLKEVKLRSDEVGELRADPVTKKDLAKLEAEVDSLERERTELQKRATEAADAAKDPDLADLAADDADKIRQRMDELKAEADRINQEIDEKIQKQREAKAQQEARRLAAEEEAGEAGRTANNICDETDGTARPDATIGDGSTEAVLREEISTGKPIKSPEGHWIKTEESISGLERAIQELNDARPAIDDPAKLKSIDETLARASDRLAKLKSGLQEWKQRGTTHPDVFNPDGSSKVTPGWP